MRGASVGTLKLTLTLQSGFPSIVTCGGEGILAFAVARRPVSNPICDKLLKANKKCRKGARVAIGSYKSGGMMSSLSAPNPCNVRARKSAGPVRTSFLGAALRRYSQAQFEHNHGSAKILAIDHDQSQLRRQK